VLIVAFYNKMSFDAVYYPIGTVFDAKNPFAADDVMRSRTGN
jgi:hypothetical protein